MKSGPTEFQTRFDVSRETIERLTIYGDLLCRWNKKINLVSQVTLDELWSRHFLDSAQVLSVVSDRQTWADLGSGGGFPGLVVAIMDPSVSVTLVESDKRKTAFLQTVLRETGISARLKAERIENVPPIGTRVVSARALASLDKLLGFAHRHLEPGGRAVFLKGAKAEDEINQALEHWQFDCEKYPSITDSQASVLSIGDIRRV